MAAQQYRGDRRQRRSLCPPLTLYLKRLVSH
jgi:hypothetical protein